MIVLNIISQMEVEMKPLFIIVGVYKIYPKKMRKYPKKMRKNGHITPKKCANTPKKCAKMVILPQKNAQIPQKNAQGIFVNICKTRSYKELKSWEIIYKLLRNNLVILEIEKLPSKIWGFLSSFLLSYDSKELVATKDIANVFSICIIG
ncbi:hypothetical protein [Xylanibacter brevis]|uniref:hypothetical protein n=1 Tax=Xylanibacter brevis TaxID=83231 RepID=UPI000480457F|nr:hypothetical protein [Xylanibacter brevis]